MIVYQSTKSEFLDNTFKRDIEKVILHTYRSKVGHLVSAAEVRSWKESLLAVAKVCNHESIPEDCGIAIEYGIPQTSKRIDVLLSGTGANHSKKLLIIELKQWQTAVPTERDGVVKTVLGGAMVDTSHPSYQAWSYAELLRNFNETIDADDVGLHPCAYLHNFTDGAMLNNAFYSDHVANAPLFLAGEEERERLRDFIAKHLKRGDRGNLIVRIESGRIRPSKRLIDALNGMLAGKREFVLIDDQKVTYETALACSDEAQEGKKRVVIVDGGPGTGKSVVAINLLVALTAKGRLTKYVTKNAAPRLVFESYLTASHKRTAISALFGGSGGFVEAPADTFDALVVDEAHRLNEKSGLYGNLGDNQIEEIIRAARCSIFFIDEDQRVTWKDIGRKGEIEDWARKAGAEITHLKLESQFRCNGSDGYLSWLDNVLGIRPTANETLDPKEFDFRVFDSPSEVLQNIRELNAGANRARMVAGYCWDWKSKSDPAAQDVVIPEHDFSMQWNLTTDGPLWITAPKSISQIGCIHTCQGLELDYVGVIVGPDLVCQDGVVKTRPERRSKHDHSIRGFKKAFAEDPVAARAKVDGIVRNTYRTLMTRGMKGCYVYFTDPSIAAYFRQRLLKSHRDLEQAAESSVSYVPDYAQKDS